MLIIRNFDLIMFSLIIEQDKGSIINLFPFSFLIKGSNFLGFIICCFNNFLSLTIFKAFSFFEIKYNSFFLPIINRQLGMGLFGLSDPLIFSAQATFSGALTNR